MSPDGALQALLVSMFDASELRTLLIQLPGSEKLLHTLPEGASYDAMVCSATQALKRHNLINPAFFDDLVESRPRWRAAIHDVRRQWFYSHLDCGAVWAGGRYELESSCGYGGFGEVWKALDHRTGERVALKILDEKYREGDVILQRFRRGAQVLRELRHPAIVAFRTEVEREGTRYYYVMEFINGPSLDQLLGERPREELLGYVMRIGEALEFVHARGFFHRDVKPNNILVTEGGEAKLIDFDFVSGDNFAAHTLQDLGTPHFAPREVQTRNPKTRAYDVFSLARTVECVLRGRMPTESGAAPCDALDVEAPIEEVLRAALQDDPRLRTQTVAQFCADFQRTWRAAEVERAAPVVEARVRAEAERAAREEAERLAREEAEARACARAEQVAREEAERRAREETEARAREEAERSAREEAERSSRVEAEARVRAEAERAAREEAERLAREQAGRSEREEARRRTRAAEAQAREDERRRLQAAEAQARRNERRRPQEARGDTAASARPREEASSTAQARVADAGAFESRSELPAPPWQMGTALHLRQDAAVEGRRAATVRLPWTGMVDLAYVVGMVVVGFFFGLWSWTANGLFVLAALLMGGLAVLSLLHKLCKGIHAAFRRRNASGPT